MSFQKLSFLPYIVIGAVITVWLYRRYEKNYFSWVKKYFFYERSLPNKISGVLNLLGILLLLISLLDLRGPEQQHKSQIPDQKTIIIIDSSASMLAEDIRPNRFQKSILLARHFIKKAVGHQVAVVLFSDTQKRLVPFTDDIDLLDSRVAGLAKNELLRGGSNISQAIMESFQYFKMNGSKKTELGGNVLVFTDSEEHENSFKLDVPDGINLAVVGVGTSRGAPIPIRSPKGVFYGYKKFQGENISTKLDEEFIKKIGSNAANFKYWITTSFSIPTEEILSFFRGIHKSKMNEGLVRTRPVYSQYVLYPAISCFILANILGGFRTFTTTALIFFLIPFGGPKAQEEEEKKPLSPETTEFMFKFKEGGMSTVDRLKLAELLAKDERPEKSLEIYGEILRPGNYTKYQIASINMGTVNLMGGKIQEGIKVYKVFNELVELSDEQKAVMRQNILLALRQQKQQQKKKNQQKQNEKKKQGGSGDQQKDNESKGDKGEQQKSQDKKNQDQNKDKDKNKQKDSDQKKKEEQEKQQQKKQLTNQPQTLDEKEEELRKKRKMVKIPAMLKQIMDTDRKLQKKYQDTSTRDRTKSRVRKDW